jgi:hypothetical protein
MRRAYGNRRDEVLEIALSHQLGALPAPPMTNLTSTEFLPVSTAKESSDNQWNRCPYHTDHLLIIIDHADALAVFQMIVDRDR